MTMLNHLHADVLCKITSLLYAHTTFKLRATGDARLIFNMKNGGVEDLDFTMPIAGTRMFTNKLYSAAHCLTKPRNAKVPSHPLFWLDFMHVRHIKMDYNVPLPSMSCQLMNHHFLKLTSVSVCAAGGDIAKNAWSDLMTVAPQFKNLQSLTFGEGVDNTSLFELPEPMKSTLTHLSIATYNMYTLDSLPPNLTFLEITGRVLDFEGVEDEDEETVDGDEISVKLDDEKDGPEDKTVHCFPENLKTLKITLSGNDYEVNGISFKNGAFYDAMLPINLSRLHIGILDSQLGFELNTHRLPRKLKHLNVLQPSGRMKSVVSIAGLPQTLESWIGDEQPLLDSTTDILHLPPSLKILNFGDAGFNPALWPNVRYPTSGLLRISNVVGVDADWGDWGNNLAVTEPFRRMIDSIKYCASSYIVVPNCRRMQFRAIDNGVELSPSLFPPNLTSLRMSTNFNHRYYDAKQMFESFPPTLTKLVLVVQVTEWTIKICKLDLAAILPSLKTLKIHHDVKLFGFSDAQKAELTDSQKEDMRGIFSPISLSRTLTKLTLRSMTLNIASILKLLPPCIEKCDIYGNVEVEDAKAGFIPPHLGSTSLKGITLSLTLYKQSILYTDAKKSTLVLLMTLIRNGNRHINSVHVQWKGAHHNMPEPDEHCCDSYYKRIEYEQ